MIALDPRVNPFRPDLAARHLQGKVEAARFVDGALRQVIEPTTDLRRAPSHEAPLDTQAVLGERAMIYETTEEGWCWAQLETDGYVGWLSENALGPLGQPPTHRVRVLRTLVFPRPDIKAPPLTALPMAARLSVVRQDERFAVTAAGWYLPQRHLAPLKAKHDDFVALAESFLGAPYLWGGKTSLGIDCSGLVQVTLQAAGIPCPRDSDMQELALGQRAALTDLRRGDLVFWKGHVGIARNDEELIHANAHHMTVTVDPLGEVMRRAKAAGSEVTSVRRVI